MPKISVIVPVYKAENFLHRCVDSVLGQTYQNFEIILVDDGSPDNCGEICDIYAAKDPRIHVIHQQNAGVSAARNAGIEFALKNSDSQWIAFVDSDDWLHCRYLECLLNAADLSGAKLSACDCIWTSKYVSDENSGQNEITVMCSEEAFVKHYSKFLPPWGKLIDKTLMDKIRFPLGIRYEDAAIMHFLVFDAEKIAISNEKLYYYFNNEESFTRISWKESHLQVIEVHKNRLDYLQKQGLERAYRRELEEYVERITSNLCSLTDVIDQDIRYKNKFNELRTVLRDAVKEAEHKNVFHFDRERLMTYMYVCPGNLVWKTARSMQRVWRKFRKC